MRDAGRVAGQDMERDALSIRKSITEAASSDTPSPPMAEGRVPLNGGAARRGAVVELPVEATRRDFEAALSVGRVVVTAPTGSGKSTRVPVWCAERGLRTLVVEPRRLACRSLAKYVARCEGVTLGKEVGYAVRHDARYEASSRVVFATPGTVLRMIQAGGAVDAQGRLAGQWDVLVLDEYHERQIDLDLLLAFALAVGIQRLVVMSATLDAARLERFLGATVVESEGRLYPVTVAYLDRPTLPTVRGVEGRVAEAVSSALDEHRGDVLVFLPGKAEIAACQQALRSLAKAHDLEVLALHGQLPPELQDKPFEPGERRRVVLATNVAETSVTLPRVGVVVDAGLVRQTRYRDGRGVLELVPVASDSAEQRRGRAGRLGPGHCVRLWGRGGRLEARTPPEVLREDLTDAVLTAAVCGFRLRRLKFLDAPRGYAVDAAVKTLTRLGCLDDEGDVTETGRLVSALPLPAHHGRFLVGVRRAVESGAAPRSVLRDAVELLAGLGVASRLFLPPHGEASEARQGWSEARCDATRLILAVRRGRARQDALRQVSLKEARRVAAQLRSLSGVKGSFAEEPTPLPSASAAVKRELLAKLWIEADPHVAYARRARGDAFGREGAEVVVDRASLLDEKVEALVAADIFTLKEKRGRLVKRVTCAIPVSLPVLRRAGLGREEITSARIERGRLVAVVRRTFAGRVLETREEHPTGTRSREALVRCLVQGSLFRKAVAETRHRIAVWNLYRRLKRLKEPAALELESWLSQRLESLGMESAEDLELLSGEDVLVPWPAPLTESERQWVVRTHPLRLDLGDVAYDVEYHLGKRTVTLVQVSGDRRKAPPLSWLPSWSGWRVQWRRGNATSVLR